MSVSDLCCTEQTTIFYIGDSEIFREHSNSDDDLSYLLYQHASSVLSYFSKVGNDNDDKVTDADDEGVDADADENSPSPPHPQ